MSNSNNYGKFKFNKFSKKSLEFSLFKEYILKLDICIKDKTIITVAGTNGKGSVSNILEHILIKSCIKTAILTSPHLVYFNERIKINGNMFNDKELNVYYQNLKEKAYKKSLDLNILSYYQKIFLLASYIFNKSDLDIIIFEVGLGGRLDPSNIFDANIAILTNVNLDHINILGSNKKQIFQEKIQITRKESKNFIGENDKNLQKFIISYLEKNNILKNSNIIGKDFFYLENLENKRIHKNNLALSFEVLKSLEKDFKFKIIGKKDIYKELKEFQVLGRLNIIKYKNSKFIIDVAHNEQSCLNLYNFTKEIFKNNLQNFELVFFLKEDKNLEDIISIMDKKFKVWHIINYENNSFDKIKVFLKKSNYEHYLYKNIEDFLSTKNNYKNYIVFGSFLIVGDFLKVLNVN